MGSDTAPDKAKVEQWWDPEKGEKVTGALTRVDCLAGGVARISVVNAGKARTFAIRDASRIAIQSAKGAQETLGCGVQRPARSVEVLFQPKPDARLGVAGDVVQLDFK